MAATKVAPQAKPAAAPSAAPGTAAPEAARAKKEKRVRVFHPLLQPTEKEKEGGKKVTVPTAKLKDIPADYDSKVHKPLKRQHFEDESQWFELQARAYDRKAAEMRKQAEEFKRIGAVPGTDKGTAKKLMKLQSQIDDLLSGMQAKGVDTEAILKVLAAKKAEAAKPKEEAKAA